MQDQEKSKLKLEVAKWCIIIAFAGLVLYAVYPKYYVKFCGNHPEFRVNTITGTTEIFADVKERGLCWREISSHFRKLRNDQLAAEHKKKMALEKKYAHFFKDLDDDQQDLDDDRGDLEVENDRARGR